MSETVIAELVSKKEMFNFIRFTEFKYTQHCKMKKNYSSFNVITADYDFEVTWMVINNFHYDGDEHFSRYWDTIELRECNKKFFGNFVIQIDGYYEYTGLFDTLSLPSVYQVPLHYCRAGDDVKITIQIYRQAENVLSINENYDKLFQSEKASDVVFTVGNEEISACKVILSSQSDVFASMFDCDMVEKETSRVKILDIEPTIFKLLLQYIYSGKLDFNNVDELIKLSLAADKYAIQSLVDICGYHIYHNITVNNAVDALIVADHLRYDFLKKYCIDFIIKNRNAIVDTEGFKDMVKSHADLFVEIFRRM